MMNPALSQEFHFFANRNTLRDMQIQIKIHTVPHFSRFDKSFTTHVDASGCRDGTLLAQIKDNGELPIIAYFSKRFTANQQHYSATQKEYIAVMLAVTHWRSYIWGRQLVCVTHHNALRYLYSMQDTSNMLTRWAITLQLYDFTVAHNP